jgi:dihydrofolate synthase/folylpolyglutamate synthase
LRAGALVNILPAGAELWLDGGHNEDGARVLAAAMADLQDRKPAPLILICGMLGTKDVMAVLKPFPELAQELVAVTIPGQLAARPASEVAAAATALGLPATTAASVEQALSQIAARSWPEGQMPRILICGSLYLAGEVLAANGTPPT